MNPSFVRIVCARERNLAQINALIAASKTLWAWPEGYLESALPLHRLGQAYLQTNPCYEVLDAQGNLVAFFAIEAGDARVVLDNLWISPQMIGRGIGRQACHYSFDLVTRLGWTQLWVLPDPPAEGFYLKLGFANTGERVSSRVTGGPVYSVLRINLDR